MNISYETLMDGIERNKRVILKHLLVVVEQLYIEAKWGPDAIEQFEKIDKLVTVVDSLDVVLGNASDFHNVAVIFAREESFDHACRILDKGLIHNTHSIDLLADYLNYGCQCNRQNECEQYFNRLMALKHRWNWRAYQFSIDYLIEKGNYSIERDDNQINDLVEKFVENEPLCEESYLTKAEWLKIIPEVYRCEKWGDETFESVLVSVTSDEFPIGRTPKCDLKLADHYYNIGKNLTQAEKLLERCILNSTGIQKSVNTTYVYLLWSLCIVSLYYKNSQNSEERDSEQDYLVHRAYDLYHIAAANATDSYVDNCKSIIEAFICETSIPYPHGDGIENRI